MEGAAGIWGLCPRLSLGHLPQSWVWSHYPGEASPFQAVWESHAYPGVPDSQSGSIFSTGIFLLGSALGTTSGMLSA